MAATAPSDYQQRPPPQTKPSIAKTTWIPLIAAFLVPTIYVVWIGGGMSNRLDAIAQDVQDNGAAISTTPSTFVPRAELDAKLDNIQLQIGHVQANVEALKEQSERQTAEIIRRIETNRPVSQ